MEKIKIAIFEDHQEIAEVLTDWIYINKHAEITSFPQRIDQESDFLSLLQSFDIICIRHQLIPITSSLLKQLTNLKLIVSSGQGVHEIDLNAARCQGIEIAGADYPEAATYDNNMFLEDTKRAVENWLKRWNITGFRNIYE